MPENTKIEWADHSWSPWRGCTKVSAGCANCYAEALADRFGPSWGGWGKGAPRIKAKNWHEPVKWNFNPWICPDCGKAHPVGAVGYDDDCNCVGRPFRGATKFRRATVFPSLCDWLDDEVPIEWLAEFLKLVHDTPNLHWLLLTKRPKNWRGRFEEALVWTNRQPDFARWQPVRKMIDDWLCSDGRFKNYPDIKPPHNVSLIVSVENQEMADKRIPELLTIPSRIRGLSLEPLLGPVDVSKWLTTEVPFKPGYLPNIVRSIDWLIIGGESGPGARPCNVDWIRSLVRQGKEAGVPVFVKQIGANAYFEVNPPENPHTQKLPLLTEHPKGGDPAEWPEDLRVREFPKFN